MSIYKIQADFKTGQKIYFRADHSPRAGLVVSKNGKILLTRQYRLLSNDMSIEIPGGRIDEGETPAQAALRETLEETGVRCTEAEMLVDYLPGMDCINNQTRVLTAQFIEDTGSFTPNELEVFDWEWYPLANCLEMIFSGQITCAMTIIGLLAYAQKTE